MQNEKYQEKIISDNYDMFVGMLLGNAHIETVGRDRHRFRINQPYIHRDYLEYLRTQLNPLLEENKELERSAERPLLGGKVSPSQIENLRIDSYTTRSGHKKLRLYTIVHPMFTEMRDRFYDKEGRKIVPENIEDYFTDRSMAY